MTLAITLRDELVKDRKRLTIPEQFNDICEKLNVMYIPVGLPNMANYIASICDILIITGSPINVSKKLYDDNFNDDETYEDKLDYALIEAFYKVHKPILGICRGLQVLNVYFGGTLKDRIPNHEGIRHDIKIKKDSNLYNIYNKEIINVNSSHVQAIDKLASNFKITAVSNDGIIEEIEDKNILGVQFHPEKDLDYKFFEELIKTYQK